tara:strand:- start:950 stop:1396 length:447 start_codon:yes stop_codon:yes gene_type:complete
MNKTVSLDYPNLVLKQFPTSSKNLFAIETCKVAVNYWVYDKRKRIVVHCGSSRACGCNHHKTSIHAEQRAFEYLIKHKKNKNHKIYIWKWGKSGDLKPAYCCVSCKQLLMKYNYQDKIFTFENDKIISAITENPNLSLGYMIKYGLSY